MNSIINRYNISFIFIVIISGIQVFLTYTIFQLDSTDQYSDIPSLLGVNIILYAILLLIYLRVFIGLGAYELIEDSHH